MSELKKFLLDVRFITIQDNFLEDNQQVKQ